jgi:hypothetical protein
MSWDSAYDVQPNCSSRHAGDRFRRRREDLFLEAALAVVSKHKSLSAGQAKAFASTFAKGIGDLPFSEWT